MSRLGHVDGLRAVAVLSVLFFHMDFEAFSGGYVGVDVFFVISGFVITRMIVRDRAAGRFDLLRFYAGRLRRLLPALMVTVAACFLGAFLVFTPDDMKAFAGSAAAAMLTCSNILFWSQAGYFDAASHSKPLLHTWTLSLEWQFYYVWPAVVVTAMAAGRNAAVAVVALLGLVSFAAMTAFHHNSSLVFYWMPFRIYEFAIGALLVWAPTASSRLLRESLFAAGFVLIVVAVFVLDRQGVSAAYNSAVAALGAGLAIYAGGIALSGRVVDNAAASWVGRISYSTYLVHWPLIVFWTYVAARDATVPEALVIAALSLALGALLYYGVELPFWKGRAAGLPVSAMMTAAIVLLVPAYAATPDGFAWRIAPELARFDKAYRDSVWGRSGCITPCSYGNTAGADKIVLVMGDSHVDHYARTMAAMAGQDTHFLHVHGGSCYFGSRLRAVPNNPATDGCAAMNAQAAKWLSKPNLDVVIRAQRWIGYASRLVDENGKPLSLNTPEELYRAELADVEELYADFKGKVILLNYVPSGRLTCLQIPQYLHLGCPPTDLANSRTFARMARELADRSGGKFVFIDPADYMCSGNRCDVLDEQGRILYADDSGHVTIFGAERIVPAIVAEIRR